MLCISFITQYWIFIIIFAIHISSLLICLLKIFFIGFLFHFLRIKALYQKSILKIFSPHLLFLFSFSYWCFLKSKSLILKESYLFSFILNVFCIFSFISSEKLVNIWYLLLIKLLMLGYDSVLCLTAFSTFLLCMCICIYVCAYIYIWIIVSINNYTGWIIT